MIKPTGMILTPRTSLDPFLRTEKKRKTQKKNRISNTTTTTVVSGSKHNVHTGMNIYMYVHTCMYVVHIHLTTYII